MSLAGGRVITLSLMLSAANILGSSGLMVWVDHSIRSNISFFDTYSPLILYLLGLSLGCCVVGVAGNFYCQSVRAKKRLLLLSCVVAFFICCALAAGDGGSAKWVELLLRFCWGWTSGCSVVLARVMLIAPENTNKSRVNFSMLSLGLACFPLIVPVVFSLSDFCQRSASAVAAACFYSVCVLMMVGMRFDVQKVNTFGERQGAIKLPTVFDFSNLVVLNVCFFLLLMLLPIVKELSFSNVDISTVYMSLLGGWGVIGTLCMCRVSAVSSLYRLVVGGLTQVGMLVCCLLMIYFDAFSLFYVVIVLAFLANILIQPVLFMSLGRHAHAKYLLFGLQSGVYILIVCGLLSGVVYFEWEIRSIIDLFWWLAAMSLVLSCLSVVKALK